VVAGGEDDHVRLVQDTVGGANAGAGNALDGGGDEGRVGAVEGPQEIGGQGGALGDRAVGREEGPRDRRVVDHPGQVGAVGTAGAPVPMTARRCPVWSYEWSDADGRWSLPAKCDRPGIPGSCLGLRNAPTALITNRAVITRPSAVCSRHRCRPSSHSSRTIS